MLVFQEHYLPVLHRSSNIDIQCEEIPLHHEILHAQKCDCIPGWKNRKLFKSIILSICIHHSESKKKKFLEFYRVTHKYLNDFRRPLQVQEVMWQNFYLTRSNSLAILDYEKPIHLQYHQYQPPPRPLISSEHWHSRYELFLYLV